MNRHEELRARLRLTLVISRREAAPRGLLELADLAFQGGATALQLREKDRPDGEFYEEALEMARFCRERGKLFIINDRLDLALAVNADGLHLGQSDLPAEVAARLLPKNKILGVSAATEAKARQALAAGADYLGVGAVFPTGSKDDATVIDPAEIGRIIDLGAPAVAIGGLTAANAGQAMAYGFTGLAVISALAAAADPRAAAGLLLI
ncbi:thiamine phosphate synthase [Deltaproteobacteria bacterium OttesenSCG-928-M10]|nr:thiamine phosphate synthase [Deltaproteobacteria bacterium OttesenSCG-928-M10]